LILAQTARYVRDRFDELLSPNSYAFRRSGEISHVTAIRKLRDYRLRYPNKKLYVAECDIQKFFDVINHEEVLAAFDSFAQRLDTPIDPRAREVLIAFLESYSSFRMVAESFPDPEDRKKIGFLQSRELALQLKRFYSTNDFASLPLGIPQGGALSPILVNLVMDCADHAVTDGAPEDLFYARFCDDMIRALRKSRWIDVQTFGGSFRTIKLSELPVAMASSPLEVVTLTSVRLPFCV
jgi:hypothetical protein